jgi:hypothetical protein
MNIRKKIESVVDETRYYAIVLLPYALWAFAIIGVVSLLSCKKEEPKPKPTSPQCDCYYQHQIFIPNMGWANDYNSDTTKMNCDAETNQWMYTNAEQTQRKTVNCL